MARVTGIGGVFIKSKGDADALTQWYVRNLGLNLEDWGGALLRWPDDHAADKGVTVWNAAQPGDDWFPGALMINYRVDNLAELIVQLKANGVELVMEPMSDDNGTFAWVVDPEGNRVELWEPKPGDEPTKA